MPKLVSKALTELTVRKARSKDKRYDLYDAALRGFGVRVATSGAKTWFVMRRVNERMVRYSLGRYPEYSLTEARATAAAALRRMTEGEHPRGDKAAMFNEVFEEWMARDQVKNRSVADVRNGMTKHALPALRSMPINAIRKADVLRLIDKIVDSGSPVQANRVLAYLRRLFNWCVERDLIADNPATGVKAPAKEVSRERVLSLDELKNVLVAAQSIGYPWGPLVEILVYTGQRLDEVAQSTWGELDLDSQVWALSGSRTKNGRPHVVHLSDAAMSTISAVPQVDGQAWLFSTSGRGPVKGFSKAKAKLDEESGVTNWTFHDLRRTFATFTTEKLNISPVVIDKVLNHTSGAVKGIAAVYQRGEYLDQRKTAMDAWAVFLSSSEFRGATVVPLYSVMSESLSPDEVFEKIAKGSSDWRNLVPSQEHDRFVGRVQQAVQIYQGLVSPKDLRSELKAFKKATRSPSAPISQLVSELSAEAQDMLSHSRPLPPPPDNPSASEAYYNDIRLRLSQGQRWKPEGDKRRKLTKVVGPPKREGRPPDQKIDVLVSLISAAYAYATGTSTYGSRGDDLPETPVEQIVGDILANLGIDTEHSAKKAVQRHIERRRAL